jgi:hypothetical protein
MASQQRFMADRAQEFTQAELSELYRLGVREAAGYIGGYAAALWSAEAFRLAATRLGGVLPIWVMHPGVSGQRAGTEMGAEVVRSMAKLWQTHRWHSVVIDCETDYYTGEETRQALIAAQRVIHEYGYHAVLYSTAGVIEDVTGREAPPCDPTSGWSGVWVASYVVARVDRYLHIDQMPTRWRAMPMRRAWQYAGNIDVSGIVIDASLCEIPGNSEPDVK